MRRHDVGGFAAVLIATASVFVTSCGQRPPSALNAMRDEWSIDIAQPAGFTVARSTPAKRIGRRELDAVDATTLTDAIVHLRPTWLREPAPDPLLRDSAPSVYVDDRFVGGVDELRLIPLGRAEEVLLLSPSSAFDRFGGGCRCAGGVILVVTRGR